MYESVFRLGMDIGMVAGAIGIIAIVCDLQKIRKRRHEYLMALPEKELKAVLKYRELGRDG